MLPRRHVYDAAIDGLPTDTRSGEPRGRRSVVHPSKSRLRRRLGSGTVAQMEKPLPVSIEVRVKKLRERLIERGAPSIAPGRPIAPDLEALVTRVRPFAQVMLIVITRDRVLG